jgi:hypothetical protein
MKSEDQILTSFAGPVIFQEFFATIELKKRLDHGFGRTSAYHMSKVLRAELLTAEVGCRALG